MGNILFPVGTSIGERLLYIPSAGLLLTCVALANLWRRRRGGMYKLVSFAFVLVGGAFVWLCADRVPDWATAESITTIDGHKQLRSSRVQFNLGNVLLHGKRYDEALATYQRAVDLDPTDRDSLPLYHAGQVLFYQGRYDEAERYLERAVGGFYSPVSAKEEEPSQWFAVKLWYGRDRAAEEIFNDYALSLWFVEKFDESILNFQKALAINADFTKALNNLACASAIGAVSGKLHNDHLHYAIQTIERAVQLDEGNILYWRNAVALLGLSGDSPAAMAAWKKVTSMDPDGSNGGPPHECSWEFYFR